MFNEADIKKTEIQARAASGRIVATFDSEDLLKGWLEKAQRATTLTFHKIHIFENEITL